MFLRSYGMQGIGLRYFNVFGPRQNPNSGYAAAIPKWAPAKLAADTVYINSDSQTSRDFCFVASTVQANVLAGTAQDQAVLN